jgi:MoxR-like ATPase
MLTTFVGQYVNDMRLVLSASLVAQEHCMLLGAPGWGKTDIAESAARNAVCAVYATSARRGNV